MNLLRRMVFKCFAINLNCQNRSKNYKIRLVESRWCRGIDNCCARLGSFNVVDLKDKESGYFCESGSFCSSVHWVTVTCKAQYTRTFRDKFYLLVCSRKMTIFLDKEPGLKATRASFSTRQLAHV